MHILFDLMNLCFAQAELDDQIINKKKKMH